MCPPLRAGDAHRVHRRSLRYAGLTIEYDERVLEPRPWTELQARWAAELAHDTGAGIRLLHAWTWPLLGQGLAGIPVLDPAGPRNQASRLLDDAAERIAAQHPDVPVTAELVAAHERGEDVARLCSGDPSVYSAIAEQTRRLDAAGVPWDITPGIAAYAATAARLGRELTVPEVAQSVVLTRAQRDSTAMPSRESLETFAATGATLVLHLAIRRTRELAERLDLGAVPVHQLAQRADALGQRRRRPHWHGAGKYGSIKRHSASVRSLP